VAWSGGATYPVAMRPELDDTLAVPAPAAARIALDDTATPVPAARAAEPERTATAPHADLDAAPGLVCGQQLGHFRIERALGAGGMGEVYLATDLALARPVAIKVLPDAVARDPARRERLVREARAQAQVTHPNVGHIYFVGEQRGRLYFAMEYVAGDTLSARLAAGPLAPGDALAIVRSAALGLREAQRSGITHRDIKPSNLMIDGHGMVKLLDFGLAASLPIAAGATASGPIAQTSLGGTPLYMAPEQARGEPVDFRADIYALGATLFHLVSGKPPFEADDLGTLAAKHATADRPSVPRRGQARTTIAAIDALCSRMMAPAAADRFASYEELIRALELASVDHVRPAGIWVRTMANAIDLLIAGVVAAITLLPLSYLVSGRTGNVDEVPILLAYAALRIVLIARLGHTPGQWLFELEVVDVVTGRQPSWRRSALRVLVTVAGPLLSVLVELVGELLGHSPTMIDHGLAAVLWLAPPAMLLWASLRSVSKQTVWDRRSRTMVRYRTRRTTSI
jgi:eukaryotic-like serine/threonine-protein kinase